MKLNRDEFFKTKMGEELLECVQNWGEAMDKIDSLDNLDSIDIEVYRKCRRQEEWNRAQFYVFQTFFRQFYGMDCHLERNDDCYGVNSWFDEWLIRFER